MRAQLIARLQPGDTASLTSLNRRLGAWIEGEYHHNPHRGLEGATPLERWASSADAVRYPDPDAELDELFLFETQRKVQSDRTVSLDGRLFEVDAALIGERVTLRYDPSRAYGSVTVVHQGKTIEQARQVDLYANCFVRRHRRTGAPQTDQPPGTPAPGLAMRDLDRTDNNDNDNDDQGAQR